MDSKKLSYFSQVFIIKYYKQYKSYSYTSFFNKDFTSKRHMYYNLKGNIFRMVSKGILLVNTKQTAEGMQ